MKKNGSVARTNAADARSRVTIPKLLLIAVSDFFIACPTQSLSSYFNPSRPRTRAEPRLRCHDERSLFVRVSGLALFFAPFPVIRELEECVEHTDGKQDEEP